LTLQRITSLSQGNVMRVAPTPLYNSFGDVQRFVPLLQEVMAGIPPE